MRLGPAEEPLPQHLQPLMSLMDSCYCYLWVWGNMDGEDEMLTGIK